MNFEKAARYEWCMRVVTGCSTFEDETTMKHWKAGNHDVFDDRLDMSSKLQDASNLLSGTSRYGKSLFRIRQDCFIGKTFLVIRCRHIWQVLLRPSSQYALYWKRVRSDECLRSGNVSWSYLAVSMEWRLFLRQTIDRKLYTFALPHRSTQTMSAMFC